MFDIGKILDKLREVCGEDATIELEFGTTDVRVNFYAFTCLGEKYGIGFSMEAKIIAMSICDTFNLNADRCIREMGASPYNRLNH